jgi:hypothetical protein
MRAIKNIFVGFLVSFIGSIPLGYLNVIGYEIFSKLGIYNLFQFLSGVICIEMFVVYFTLVFATPLVNNKKLMKTIDVFAVFFLLILSYSFYASTNNSVGNQSVLKKHMSYSPFLIGVLLNCINFLQLPFWTGWNLYLLNGKFISLGRKYKFFYVGGTIIGTFIGMLSLILLLDSVSSQSFRFSQYIIPVCIPLFFVIMSVVQMVKVYRKYYKKRSL